MRYDKACTRTHTHTHTHSQELAIAAAREIMRAYIYETRRVNEATI